MCKVPTHLTALMMVSGPRQSVVGFLLAQISVIITALVPTLGVGDIPQYWAGYLGVIPLTDRPSAATLFRAV